MQLPAIPLPQPNQGQPNPPSGPPTPTIFPLFARAGVQRDGTLFDCDYCTDNLWNRFQPGRGRARKIGGYREAVNSLTGPVSELFCSSRNGLLTVHSGSPSNLERVQLNQTGIATGVTDRTPASGFVPDANNVWQFDALYNAGNTTASIIAHAAPNAAAIDQETATNIFIGDLNGTAALTQISGSNSVPTVSGGVVAAYPYMFYYGDNGFVTWSGPNLPADCSVASGGGGLGGARITSSKIVRGLIQRAGPNTSPAVLFWSLDSLISASFVGGAAIFSFNTISDQSSIMSSNCMIEYDGIFYWLGIDRFLLYNGVVQELPNQMNCNFLFDNLNYAARQAVFVHKIPRFGEIWFCVPLFGATVANWAIIYNVQLKTWYDTPLPDGGRSAAYFSQTFHYPLMAGTVAGANGKYSLWQHEYGVDRVALTGASPTTAIEAFFETGPIANAAEGPLHNGWSGTQRNVDLSRIEPDFVVTGPLTLTVRGFDYAMGAETDTVYALNDSNGAVMPHVDTRAQRRQMRFKIESNSVGGNYFLGKILITLGLGDERP